MCAARPPLLAISRCFSGDIDANPRRSFRRTGCSVMLSPLPAVRISSFTAIPPTLEFVPASCLTVAPGKDARGNLYRIVYPLHAPAPTTRCEGIDMRNALFMRARFFCVVHPVMRAVLVSSRTWIPSSTNMPATLAFLEPRVLTERTPSARLRTPGHDSRARP
jgi:hypothetical protein